MQPSVTNLYYFARRVSNFPWNNFSHPPPIDRKNSPLSRGRNRKDYERRFNICSFLFFSLFETWISNIELCRRGERIILYICTDEFFEIFRNKRKERFHRARSRFDLISGVEDKGRRGGRSVTVGAIFPSHSKKRTTNFFDLWSTTFPNKKGFLVRQIRDTWFSKENIYLVCSRERERERVRNPSFPAWKIKLDNPKRDTLRSLREEIRIITLISRFDLKRNPITSEISVRIKYHVASYRIHF